ncbi:MAG: MarR family transcriptional regulator [Methylacidiphilaceae bacterium]|nr:MarR family transcriptional regulator [Candidatus Methylacidiphilaceae bacterium]
MSRRNLLPWERTSEVRDACLCLHVQQAGRALARYFDDLFRPLGITSGQFSLLMSLNRPDAPVMGEVAELLAMDRTTLTAALKPLERQGFVSVAPDKEDRRKRRLLLTDEGRALLAEAWPLWREGHAVIEGRLREPDRLRADLRRLARPREASERHVGQTDRFGNRQSDR